MTYFKQGFIYIKGLLDERELLGINANIKTLTPSITLPDNITPWGYGNLVDDSRFNFILTNTKLNKELGNILHRDYIFNHLLITSKSKWIGPPVEWHQEMSLVNTYAAGYNLEDVNNFAQIYIAIDEHTVDNGCLKIFPGSHTLGLLEHRDIIGYNLNHKKQLTVEELDKLNSTHPVEKINMKPGDCLIFNHLLVHGSGSNTTPYDRKAFVLQARTDSKELDLDLFNSYSKFRTQYAIDYFTDRVTEYKVKNLYKDFNSYDKKNDKQ